MFPLLPLRVQHEVERRRLGLWDHPWRPAGLPARLGIGEAPEAFRGPDRWWHNLRAGLLGGPNPLGGYYERLGRRLELELPSPFVDRRLIELALTLPPDALYRDGRTKVILREALGDLLPPVVRDRTDKAVLTPLMNEGLRVHRRTLVESLLDRPELVARELVDERAWSAAVRGYLAGDDSNRAMLWPTITTELWLRHRAGRLDP